MPHTDSNNKTKIAQQRTNEALLRKFHTIIKPSFNSKYMRAKFRFQPKLRYHSFAPQPKQWSADELMMAAKLMEDGSSFSQFLQNLHDTDAIKKQEELVEAKKQQPAHILRAVQRRIMQQSEEKQVQQKIFAEFKRLVSHPEICEEQCKLSTQQELYEYASSIVANVSK